MLVYTIIFIVGVLFLRFLPSRFLNGVGQVIKMVWGIILFPVMCVALHMHARSREKARVNESLTGES